MNKGAGLGAPLTNNSTAKCTIKDGYRRADKSQVLMMKMSHLAPKATKIPQYHEKKMENRIT